MYPEEHLTTRVQLVQDNMTAEQSVGSGGQVVEPIIRKEEVKLPRINIPKFSGEYQHWMSFHDMYTALVHNNKSITNIEKLHYLKSSLQGEAEEFVRHFTITDANYQVAWKALQERYDNRRILIKTQLKLLFSQTVANVESASNIRKILDTTNECIQALENLGIDTQHWDVMITHLVSERLPIETKKTVGTGDRC